MQNRVSALIINNSILKREEVCSSETLVPTYMVYEHKIWQF